MTEYRFGYLLIRLNKLLAAVLLVSAAVCSYFIYSRAILAVELVHYRSSPALELETKKVIQTFAVTKDLVLKARGVARFPDEFESASVDVNIPKQVITNNDFDQAKKELDRLSDGGLAMKRFLINSFDVLISEIITKLDNQASQLRKTTFASTNVAPPLALEQQGDQRQDSLYSDNMDRSEVTVRIGFLANAKESLAVLENQAVQQENKQVLRDTMAELDIFARLLEDIALTPAQKAETPIENVSAESKIYAAEKVAAKLAAIKAIVEKLATTSWALDEDLESVQVSLSEERLKWDKARIQVQAIWNDAALTISGLVAVSFLAAFFLMVVADLLKAIFVTANSSAIVAKAYIAAEIEE